MYSGGAENYKRTTTQLQGRGEAPPSGGPPCLSRAELMGTGSSTSAPSNGRAGQSGTITQTPGVVSRGNRTTDDPHTLGKSGNFGAYAPA